MNDVLPIRWFSYEARAEHDFEDEMVLSCFVGKLFHYWQGRNAWWGKWSELYPGGDSFCIEFEETKKRIEKERTQGTKWTIEELPVLIFAGKDDALLIGEINSNRPLSEIKLPAKLNLTLVTLGEVFAPRRPNSIYRFFMRSKSVVPARMPFLSHESESLGTYYPLGWNTSRSGVDLDPLLKIAVQVCKRLQNQ